MSNEPAVQVTITDSSDPEVVGRSWITKESGEHIFPEDVAPLTFDLLRATNLLRCNRWHDGFPDNTDGWGSGDWGNAMQGEVGELAEVFAMFVAKAGSVGNLVKKTRRIDHNLMGNRGAEADITLKELVVKMEREAADVIIYLDLLMAYFHSDLGQVVAAKFNEVSDQLGFPEHLPA